MTSRAFYITGATMTIDTIADVSGKANNLNQGGGGNLVSGSKFNSNGLIVLAYAETPKNIRYVYEKLAYRPASVFVDWTGFNTKKYGVPAIIRVTSSEEQGLIGGFISADGEEKLGDKWIVKQGKWTMDGKDLKSIANSSDGRLQFTSPLPAIDGNSFAVTFQLNLENGKGAAGMFWGQQNEYVYYYFLVEKGESLKVYKHIDGKDEMIQKTSIYVKQQLLGSKHDLRVNIEGSLHQIFVDNETHVTFEDDFFLGGYFGLLTSKDTSATFHDIKAYTVLNEWHTMHHIKHCLPQSCRLLSNTVMHARTNSGKGNCINLLRPCKNKNEIRKSSGECIEIKRCLPSEALDKNGVCVSSCKIGRIKSEGGLCVSSCKGNALRDPKPESACRPAYPDCPHKQVRTRSGECSPLNVEKECSSLHKLKNLFVLMLCTLVIWLLLEFITAHWIVRVLRVRSRKGDTVKDAKPGPFSIVNVYVDEEKPVNVNKEKPVNVNKEKSVNVNEEKPVSVSKEKHVNVSKEKPVNVSKENPNTTEEEETSNTKREKSPRWKTFLPLGRKGRKQKVAKGPICHKGCTMKWSNYAKHAYKHAYGCDTCGEVFPSGTYRWFCKAHWNDRCANCAPNFPIPKVTDEEKSTDIDNEEKGPQEIPNSTE
eukprot:g5202.t1